MKNTHAPTEEEFILTHKKMRMIKALMREFATNYSSSTYSDINYIPKSEYFEMYLKRRLIFLKNIKINCYIEVINNTFTGLCLYFQHEKFYIFEETHSRQMFFKTLDLKDYQKIILRGLTIEDPKPL
jgi:hypothetical protein